MIEVVDGLPEVDSVGAFEEKESIVLLQLLCS
jgi:hypothetical protein